MYGSVESLENPMILSSLPDFEAWIEERKRDS